MEVKYLKSPKIVSLNKTFRPIEQYGVEIEKGTLCEVSAIVQYDEESNLTNTYLIKFCTDIVDSNGKPVDQYWMPITDFEDVEDKMKFYQPTEYEELMIAAGWLTLAELDEGYQRYLATTPVPAEYVCTYEQWKDDHERMIQIGQRLDTEVEPFYREGFGLPHEKRDLEQRLLDELNRIEYSLGY